VFVACSNQCFANYPLDRALRIIAELEFNKLDVTIEEQSPHLTIADVLTDVGLAAQKIRIGPSLSPAAFTAIINTDDVPEYHRQLRGLCHLARLSNVTVVTVPAAPSGSDLKTEIQRLASLVHLADTEGVVLSVATRIGTLTEDPDTAEELCLKVAGLGLTLDPSHFISGPNQGCNFDHVVPYVRHVHLRDSTPGQFQVRVGQGEVEYGRIVAQLARHHYSRLLTVDIQVLPDASYGMEHEVRKLKYLLESLV
jgi:sugar phosphate isomerase/epimerase